MTELKLDNKEERDVSFVSTEKVAWEIATPHVPLATSPTSRYHNNKTSRKRGRYTGKLIQSMKNSLDEYETHNFYQQNRLNMMYLHNSPCYIYTNIGFALQRTCIDRY